MTGFIKQITQYFRKPDFKQQVLQKVLDRIDESRNQGEHCSILISRTGVVIESTAAYPAPIALIAHEKIGEFQQTLLFIEDELIKKGHYCLVKLAEDKSYATMFIIVDESILI